LKNRIVLGIAIVIILLVSLPAADVAREQPIENSALADNQVPIVDSPIDIVYVEGTTGHIITWHISDDDPERVLIFMNGEFLTETPWENLNESIHIIVDGLTRGNYEFMILATDGIHNITDTVLVKVLSVDIEIHAPFSISSNTNFNDTAQAEGWIGNGSITNPFIIEKLYIEASYDCISIHGTTAYFIIRNCTFVKSGIESGIGLNMQSVDNGVIENCTFTNLWMGCITWFVSNCTWHENSFGNLMDGIWLQESLDCVITDNTFQSGGISFAGYSVLNWIHEISGNTIGEKKIGYYASLSNTYIVVENYGQVILANCSEVTILSGDFSNVGIPLSIGHSNFSGAKDCRINGGRIGIFIERTYETTLDTCQIIGSSEVGLYINETVGTTVFNCTVKNIGYVGAQIGMGSDTTIIETTFKGCGDTAIVCYECPNFLLMDSIIEDNNNGLHMGGCSDSEIVNNSFLWNDQYGVYILWDCEGSRFYANVIGFNYIDNAFDDGSGTLWDDGSSIGNLWDDYTGTGFYYVPGSRGGIDHYPGIIDLAHGIDIIDITDDITYTYGTTGHNIVWYPNCTHPAAYHISKDGYVVEQQNWAGSEIIYNVDNLEVGVYNFTLTILDMFNETASDSVIVTVNPQTTATVDYAPTPNTTATTNGPTVGGIQQITLVISIGSTIVIVVVIVLMLRTKQNP